MKFVILIVLLNSINAIAANSKTHSKLVINDKKQNSWDLSAGIAGISSSISYKDTSASNKLFPLIIAKKGAFSFEADRFKFTNQLDKNLSAVSYVKYDAAPFDTEDSKYLEGMDDKSAGAGIGQVFEFKNGSLSYGLDLNTVAGQAEHGFGSSVYSKYSQAPLIISGNLLILKYSIGLNYTDAQKGNYRYGVKGSEQNLSLGRTAYKTGETFSTSAMIESAFVMGQRKNWILINNLTATYLDKKIVNSPIIDTDKKLLYVFGLAYKL
jgi:outer membrane scaffolding protein for murein synthesis (MipA/OmpV family)